MHCQTKEVFEAELRKRVAIVKSEDANATLFAWCTNSGEKHGPLTVFNYSFHIRSGEKGVLMRATDWFFARKAARANAEFASKESLTFASFPSASAAHAVLLKVSDKI